MSAILKKSIKLLLVFTVSGIMLLSPALAAMPAWAASDEIEVKSTSPDDGDDDVKVTAKIKITFDTTLDEDSVDSDCVTITDEDDDEIDFEYDVSGKTITITPDDDLDEDTDYDVEISDDIEGEDGESFDGDDFSFTTEDEGSSSDDNDFISSTSPEDGDDDVNTGASISVKFTDDMEENSIDEDSFYIREKGSSKDIDATVKYSSKRATLTPDDDLDEDTKYVVYLTDDIENEDGDSMEDYDFTFTTEDDGSSSSDSDFIDSTTPDDGDDDVDVSTSIKVEFSDDMKSSTIDEDSFYLREKGSSKDIDCTVTYSSSSTTATLNPDDDLDENTDYIAYVTADIETSDGDEIDRYSWDFTTEGDGSSSSDDDLGNDMIDSVDPGDGDKSVPVTTKVTVKFAESMDSDTIDEDSFYLRKKGSSSDISATVKLSSRTATLTPDDDLAGGTEYTAYLGSSIENSDGDRLGSESWSFTTAGATSSTGTISNAYPSDGATGVDPSTSIRFNFGEKMDSDSVIDKGNITLTDASGRNIDMFVFYTDSTKEVLLKPASVLSGGTKYTIDVTKNVETSGGKAFKATSWSFTTSGSGGGGSTGQIGTSTYPLVRYNGNYVNFSDARPYVKKSRTYVPMRALFEMIGATISWDNAQQKVTAISGGNTVELYIGKSAAYKNGTKVILDAAPELSNGRTMIPLRFASEALGVTVTWDASTYTIDMWNN